jgi:ribosomal protein S18 acetylase RimI-like enzyme
VTEVRLRPLRDEELPAYIERTRAEYAEDIERNAGLSRKEARAKAERDTAGLFPGGRPAAGQQLRVVEDAGSGETLGRIHFSERPPGSRTAWLWDIAIEEHARGRGLGRAAMKLFEEELRRGGFTRVSLNVFGGNERARALYRSLGYREVAVEMSKDIDASSSSDMAGV